jgi:protein-arginine kinase activator protein McsA
LNKSHEASTNFLWNGESEELINPDEFEEIAEIYDQVRLLHSRLSPDLDTALT